LSIHPKTAQLAPHSRWEKTAKNKAFLGQKGPLLRRFAQNWLHFDEFGSLIGYAQADFTRAGR
jgi:hypothetical protein